MQCVETALLPLLDRADDARGQAASGMRNATGSFKPVEELEEIIASHLTDDGQDVKGFQQAVAFLGNHSINTSSPGFLDKLYSAPSPPGIAAELFLATLNNNSHVWSASPALSAVEKHLGRRLARLFGLGGEHAGGVTAPGGAASNLLAMLVARNIVAPGTKRHGTPGGQGQLSIFVSDQAHYSVANAAQIIGLGSDSVVLVGSTPDGAMDVEKLQMEISRAALDRGTRPLAVVATAGTTVRGAFDPLEDVGRIARRHGAWYHVDACWGGAAVFSDRLRPLLKGSELADSISFNPHKLLGVPLVCSYLIARDLRTLWAANRLEAGYLFHEDNCPAPLAIDPGSPGVEFRSSKNGTNGCCTPDQHGPDREWDFSSAILNAPPASQIKNLASLTAQCGRRPDATKFYLHWVYYGSRNMARDVEKAVDSARYMAELVAQSPYLDAVGSQDIPFTQVCFYWKSTRTGTMGDPATMNSQATRALCAELAKEGWMIDYAPGLEKHGQHGDFLRVPCHRLTDRQVVKSMLRDVVRVGLELDL